MKSQTHDSFRQLLEKFCKEHKFVVVINPALGGVRGLITEVSNDYIRLLTQTPRTDDDPKFTSVYIPNNSIYGIEISEKEEE